jgi:hypothetical protein
MSEEIPTELSNTEGGKIIVPPLPVEPMTGEQLLEGLQPSSVEEAPEPVPDIARNDTPEVQLSVMGGGKSFDDLKHIVRSRDQDNLNTVAQAMYRMPVPTAPAIQILKEIARTRIPDRTIGGYTAEAILGGHTPERKAIAARDFNIAEGKNILRHSVGKNLGLKGDYVVEMGKPNEAAVEALRILKPTGTPINEESAFNNVLEYVNPLGGENPDGMDIEVWDAMVGIVTGDFDSEAFDKQMTSNYGEEWVGRFTSFAVKEVAIDGALLILASTVWGAPLAAYLFSAKTAYKAKRILQYSQPTLKATAKSILARSAVIGVGGGSVQAGQNYVLDRDLNFGSEVAMRMGGSAIFDTAALGLRAGFKTLKGSNKKDIIASAATPNIKPLSNKEVVKIMDGEAYSIGPYAALTRDNLFKKIEGYEKISSEASDDILRLDDASDEVIEGLSNFLGVSEAELKNIKLDVIMDDLTGFKRRIEKEGSDYANNQVGNAQGMAPHIMSKIRGEYVDGNEMAQMYVDGGTLQFRATDNNLNSSNISTINTILKVSRLAEPDRVAGRSGADILDVNDLGSRIANGFGKLYKDALGNRKVIGKGTTKFSEDELRTIDGLLQEGDANSLVYDFDNIFPSDIPSRKITREIEVAYMKTRLVMDFAYEIRNSALTKNLKGSTVDVKTGRLFNYKDQLVEITHILPNNKYKAKVYDADELSSLGGTEFDNITIGSLKEIDSVIPYRNGHIPRGYTDHSYSLLSMNPKTGKVSREAMYNNRLEAQNALADREKLLSEGEAVTLVFNKANATLNGSMFHRNSINVLDAVTDEQKDVLMKQLTDMGLDSESVRYMFKSREQASRSTQGGVKARTDLGTATTEAGKLLRMQHAKANQRVSNAHTKVAAAAKALGEAPKKLIKELEAAQAAAAIIRRNIETNVPNEIAPTQESIIEYLSMVAKQSGHDIWQRTAIDNFNGEFGKYLIPEGTWKNASTGSGKFFNTSGDFIPDVKLRKHIEGYSRFLNRNITKTTQYESGVDQAIMRKVDDLGRLAADGNYVALKTQLLWDNIPMSKDFLNFARFQTAFPKLLFYPFIQTYIQASQAITTLSSGLVKDPVGLAQALSQYPRITLIAAKKYYDQPMSKLMVNSDSNAAYNDLVNSGYAADLSTSDTLWSSKLSLSATGFKKFIKRLNQGGALPFRGGEGINRVTAFLVVRKQFMRSIDKYETALKQGVKGEALAKIEKNMVRGRDGEILRAVDIGSSSYLTGIKTKAKVLAFNMGKSGELEAFSGFGSVVFQFKQVGIKQLAMFDSTQLNVREKIAVAAGTMALFGSGALPFIPDMFVAADAVGYEVTGNNPSKLYIFSDYADEAVKWTAGLFDADPEYTKLLLQKGIITASTMGEVDIASRIAIGNIWSDTFDVQNWYDFIPATAVLADYIEMAHQTALRDVNANILNIPAWIDFSSYMLKGLSFKESALKFYTPESSIGKWIVGDNKIGTMSMEIFKSVGKVYSQFGSISRAAEAAYPSTAQPSLDLLSPQGLMTKYYAGTDVEVTPLGQFMLMTGLLPGRVTKYYDDANRKYALNGAINDLNKRLKEDLKRPSGKDGGRVINKYFTTMQAVVQAAEKWGIDAKIVKDARAKARLMMSKLTIQYATGKEL